MWTGYGLKIVEYLFCALAILTALPLSNPALIQGVTPTDIAAVVFILVGVGVLLPRAIAYLRWQKVLARVGSYDGTWDGERSATYSYEVGKQRYTGSFRSMYGTETLTRLEVFVNPHAPWVRYPLFWNVWSVGAVLLAGGLFLLFSDVNFFG